MCIVHFGIYWFALLLSNVQSVRMCCANDTHLAEWFQGPNNTPDSKVHGANMEPIWGRQDPGGPHVGPMNFAIWDVYRSTPYIYHFNQWLAYIPLLRIWYWLWPVM